MAKAYTPLAVLAMLLFAIAPLAVASAPPEQTMGLIQRVFYYHVPSAMMLFLSAFICGISSAVFLFKRSVSADRLAVAAGELAVVFGLIVLVTGPMWARKAWGVWWQWDARLTSSLLLWMMFVAYLLVRRYGGGLTVARFFVPDTSIYPRLAPPINSARNTMARIIKENEYSLV